MSQFSNNADNNIASHASPVNAGGHDGHNQERSIGGTLMGLASNYLNGKQGQSAPNNNNNNNNNPTSNVNTFGQQQQFQQPHNNGGAYGYGSNNNTSANSGGLGGMLGGLMSNFGGGNNNPQQGFNPNTNGGMQNNNSNDLSGGKVGAPGGGLNLGSILSSLNSGHTANNNASNANGGGNLQSSLLNMALSNPSVRNAIIQAVLGNMGGKGNSGGGSGGLANIAGSFLGGGGKSRELPSHVDDSTRGNENEDEGGSRSLNRGEQADINAKRRELEALPTDELLEHPDVKRAIRQCQMGQ